jgi:hypothetical protein
LEEGGVDEKEAAEASRRSETSSTPPFDPAGLPPVESIGADSDIRQFHQAGVPVELARAALRSAWAADPSIRDFIGLAESQWDFNEPAAIPGFGSLGARDCALAAQLLASLGNETEEASARPAPDPQCRDPVDGVGQFSRAQAEEPVTRQDDVQTHAVPRARRSHGGALPR